MLSCSLISIKQGRHGNAEGGGKITFADLAGVPYWLLALALAAALVVLLLALENWRPWRQELGRDVDGDLTK